MDTDNGDEDKVVKLIHDNPVDDELLLLHFTIFFKSGHSLESEGTSYIYEPLGVDTIGIINQHKSDLPHVIININNVEWIEYVVQGEE